MSISEKDRAFLARSSAGEIRTAIRKEQARPGVTDQIFVAVAERQIKKMSNYAHLPKNSQHEPISS